MPLIVSLMCGFLPMLFFAWLVYWLDRYEKEPKILLGGVFLWGAILAAGAAFMLNTALGVGVYLFTNDETATELATGSLIAPVIEELLKAAAVLLVFLIARKEFDSLVDGLVYAAIVALGFAATENTLYIYRDGYLANGYGGVAALAFVRVVLVGWQHPFYTSFTGIGLAAARLSKGWLPKIIYPATGLVLAIFTHALHNTFAAQLQGVGGLILSTLYDWSGWIFMFLFVVWSLFREQQWIAHQLREEVANGVITAAQYRTACSTVDQSVARFGGLMNGRFRSTNRFYQLCAELSFKKQQRQSFGEEGRNTSIIKALRTELAALSPLVIA